MEHLKIDPNKGNKFIYQSDEPCVLPSWDSEESNKPPGSSPGESPSKTPSNTPGSSLVGQVHQKVRLDLYWVRLVHKSERRMVEQVQIITGHLDFQVK